MQGGDQVKVERLAREAYRIRVQIYGNDHCFVGASIWLLANTMQAQGKPDETLKLTERAVAINIRNEGPDGSNTVKSTVVLGNYYQALLSLH
jgi:hypothetical protein